MAAGGLFYLGGVFVAEFMVDLLDFCLIPFIRTDSLLVVIPTACLTVYFLFLLVRLLMGGGR